MNNLPRKSKAEIDLTALSDEDLLRLYDIINEQYKAVDPNKPKWKRKVGSRLFPVLDEIAKRNIWFKEH